MQDDKVSHKFQWSIRTASTGLSLLQHLQSTNDRKKWTTVPNNFDWSWYPWWVLLNEDRENPLIGDHKLSPMYITPEHNTLKIIRWVELELIIELWDEKKEKVKRLVTADRTIGDFMEIDLAYRKGIIPRNETLYDADWELLTNETSLFATIQKQREAAWKPVRHVGRLTMKSIETI